MADRIGSIVLNFSGLQQSAGEIIAGINGRAKSIGRLTEVFVVQRIVGDVWNQADVAALAEQGTPLGHFGDPSPPAVNPNGWYSNRRVLTRLSINGVWDYSDDWMPWPMMVGRPEFPRLIARDERPLVIAPKADINFKVKTDITAFVLAGTINLDGYYTTNQDAMALAIGA